MNLIRRIERLESTNRPTGNATIYDVIAGETEPAELNDGDRVLYEKCFADDEPHKCSIEAAIEAVGHLESSE